MDRYHELYQICKQHEFIYLLCCLCKRQLKREVNNKQMFSTISLYL